MVVTSLLLQPSTSQAQTIQLQIGSKTLTAELAATYDKMIIGLSKTKRLSLNTGMLFVFPFTVYHCMTMKDTSIPLSLVFLDSNFNIIESINMKPLSAMNYCASKPAAYAIEAANNWFNTVPVNTKVVILK